MRPKISVALRGLKDQLKKFLMEKLRENGPLFESEIRDYALGFFTPYKESLSKDLIKKYNMLYGRKIGRKTAVTSVLNAFKNLLAEIKEEIPHTEKAIILGKKRFGRIFYLEGQEHEIPKKVLVCVEKTDSIARDVLNEIRKKGFVEINPRNRKAVELLEHFAIVEIAKFRGKKVAKLPGIDLEFEEINKGKDEGFIIVYRPFYVTVVIEDGNIKKKRIKFDFAGIDKQGCFVVGLEKEYVSATDIRDFLIKYFASGIKAKAVCKCKEISEAARRLCKSWGIRVWR